jgi:hypothetical protein
VSHPHFALRSSPFLADLPSSPCMIHPPRLLPAYVGREMFHSGWYPTVTRQTWHDQIWPDDLVHELVLHLSPMGQLYSTLLHRKLPKPRMFSIRPIGIRVRVRKKLHSDRKKPRHYEPRLGNGCGLYSNLFFRFGFLDGRPVLYWPFQWRRRCTTVI